MHDIDTFLLRSFVTLAETGSFTKTAERIGRSQGAVSMQINKLEDMLDCQLVKRDKRNVSLTTDGEKLLGYARQIVGMSEAMITRFREPDVIGEIRFGSPEDFATSYLPDIIATFAEAHPQVALHVNCDLTLSLIKGFEQGDYDLIVIKQEPDRLYDGADALWRERLVWVGGPQIKQHTRFLEYLNNGNEPLPLVLAPQPCVYRARATAALDEGGVPWKITYTSPSVAGAMAAVRAGLGVTVLPRKMVPSDLVPLEGERGWPRLLDSEICLLMTSNPTPAMSAFRSFIKQRISFNQ